MDEMGPLLKKFPKKDFFKKSQRDSSEEVKAPDQKWSLDIKHFKTLDGDKNNNRIHRGIGYKTPKERYLEFVTRKSLANVSG